MKTTSVRRTVSLPLLVVLAALAAAPDARAQWWWPPTNPMSVEPACPHPSAPFDITLSGTWHDSCKPNLSSTTVTGNRIDFYVIQDPPPGFCLTVLTPWSRVETVGPLPAGTYEVYAIWLVGTAQQGQPVLMGTIDVSASCPAPCYPDCNADNALTIADFGCFQSKFVGADPYADCNQDTYFTISDFGCFQSKFVAGCP